MNISIKIFFVGVGKVEPSDREQKLTEIIKKQILLTSSRAVKSNPWFRRAELAMQYELS